MRNSLNANSKHETGVRLGKLQLKPSHLLPKLPLISAINRREIPQENHLTSGNHELLIKGAVDLAEKPKPRLTSIGVPNHYVRSSNLPTESREDFSRKFESFSTKIDDESEPDFDMLISIEENILCALGDEGFDEYDYPMMLSKAIKTKLENMRKHRTLH